jgi:hypothetical protein
MDKSMSPKKVIPVAKSEKRSKSRADVEALNDEYLRGNQISPPSSLKIDSERSSLATVSRQLLSSLHTGFVSMNGVIYFGS